MVGRLRWIRRLPEDSGFKIPGGTTQRNDFAGIYELDGNDWKICLAFAGLDRPKRFVTERGSGHALETLADGSSAKKAVWTRLRIIWNWSSDVMKSERRADAAHFAADNDEMANCRELDDGFVYTFGSVLPPNFLKRGSGSKWKCDSGNTRRSAYRQGAVYSQSR